MTANDDCPQPEFRRPTEPCLPGHFCRNHYYTGKLLTARDFQMEQSYFRDKLRLHHLALHGWGVVCGLKIHPHKHPNCHRIVLGTGMAIDPCGREIRVLCTQDYQLPGAPPQPVKPGPCDDEGQPQDEKTAEKSAAANRTPPPDEPDTYAAREHPDQYGADPADCPEPVPAIDLYICLSYAECDEEIGPAPFDECSCDGPQQQPNRTCEGFRLEILLEKPEWWDQILSETCDARDCTVLWEQGRECRWPPSDICCVPLAVIHSYVADEPLKQSQIEDVGSRLQLPSTTLIKQVVDCILEKLPLKDYTVIDSINWTHGRDYKCHEFMRQFVGAGKAFEVGFSNKINRGGVSKRTFQLLVVYRDKPSVPREMHVAPAEVQLSSEGDSVRIVIDEAYARHYLDRRRFDLYVRIYCDKLIDDNGDPVDGDLLAHRNPDDDYSVTPPTGNGTPGGTFDSWILVR